MKQEDKKYEEMVDGNQNRTTHIRNPEELTAAILNKITDKRS